MTLDAMNGIYVNHNDIVPDIVYDLYLFMMVYDGLLLEKNRRSELNGLFDNFNQIINI